DSNNTPEECSVEENLLLQLDDEVSDLEEDISIEIEQVDEEIMQAIQNMSFEETVAINEENLEDLEFSQQVKLICKAKSDVWKFVDKETRNLTVLSKKHSPKIQAEKTQAILNWIILTFKPFKVIEEKAFHNMVQKLDPFYQIPVRKTIYNLIINQFDQQRNLIKNYFNGLLSKVALTADFWTSLKMENFIAITIHFIDNNWKLQHFVLDIFQFK
ncbi:33243_t:CDS:2, partial [Racocetra persica]